MPQRKIMWFAIVFSTVVYAAIAFTIAGKPSRPFDEAVRNPIALALYVAALGAFVSAIVVSSLVRAKNPSHAFVVALAIFEACATLGLAAAFIARDWRLYLAPWALALIGFVRAWPQDDALPQ